MAVSDEDVARALEKALALMNDKGAHWIKGKYKQTDQSGEVSYCSIGAIREVTQGRKTVREKAVSALSEGLDLYPWGTPYERRRRAIEQWNDRAARQWDDVVKRFRDATQRLRKQK